MDKVRLTGIILASILVLLLLFRAVTPIELDDVHPNISCENNLLAESDVLWVVPLFQNDSIANYPDWCNAILSLNKTLGLHGVYHTYHEFGFERDDIYLHEGIIAFQDCFKFTPTLFKAPQLFFNNSNEDLLERQGLELKGKFNQRIHKVYHCDDTGEFPNWFVKLI